ncbi:ferredoxin [Nocardioides sp. NPDC051685]|uniref:ferredoxin n=1 Tax=Nocardioides sp. NPDC051685 TaxID=3364334 RepID=UPI00379AE14D
MTLRLFEGRTGWTDPSRPHPAKALHCLEGPYVIWRREMAETDATDAQKWRVDVSRACISSGMCLAVAPDNFEFVGVRARPTTELIHSAAVADLVKEAEDDCPVGAISVVEEPRR